MEPWPRTEYGSNKSLIKATGTQQSKEGGWGEVEWEGQTEESKDKRGIECVWAECVVDFFREFSAERIRWVVNLRGRQAGAQGGPLQSDSLASKQQHRSPRWTTSNHFPAEPREMERCICQLEPPDQCIAHRPSVLPSPAGLQPAAFPVKVET